MSAFARIRCIVTGEQLLPTKTAMADYWRTVNWRSCACSVTSESDKPPGEHERKQSRPKSVVYQAVEDKMFLLDQLHSARHTQDAAATRPDDNGSQEDDEETADEQEEELKQQQYRVEYESSSHCQ